MAPPIRARFPALLRPRSDRFPAPRHRSPRHCTSSARYLGGLPVLGPPKGPRAPHKHNTGQLSLLPASASALSSSKSQLAPAQVIFAGASNHVRLSIAALVFRHQRVVEFETGGLPRTSSAIPATCPGRGRSWFPASAPVVPNMPNGKPPRALRMLMFSHML